MLLLDDFFILCLSAGCDVGITGQRGNGEQEVIRTHIPASSGLRKARRVKLHQHLFIIHNSHTLPLPD